MFALLKQQSVGQLNRTFYRGWSQLTGEREVLLDILYVPLSDFQQTLRTLRCLWGVRLEATNGFVAHGANSADL